MYNKIVERIFYGWIFFRLRVDISQLKKTVGN